MCHVGVVKVSCDSMFTMTCLGEVGDSLDQR